MRHLVGLLAAGCCLLGIRTGPLTAGETVFESTDFESSNGGFSSSDVFEWGTPTYPLDLSPHSGKKLWGTNLDGVIDDSPGSYLLQHALNVPDHVGSTFLSWWDWFDSDGVDERQLVVDDFSLTHLIFDDATTSQTTWTRHTIEISKWAGQPVLLKFHLSVCCEPPGIDGWYLDDFSVVGTDYYFWNFEGNDAGFSPAEFSDWEYGISYAGNPVAPHSGSAHWATNLDGLISEPAVHDLTKTVTVPSDVHYAYLTFWEWYDTDGADNRSVIVDDGSPAPVYTAVDNVTEWTQVFVDLSAYAGQTVDLIFRLDAGGSPPGGYGWYIDDVGIGDPRLFADGFESGDSLAWSFDSTL